MEEPTNPSDPRILIAQGMIATDLPFITADNWAQASQDGWRFRSQHSPRHLEESIRSAQDEYGSDSVTLGGRFPRHSEVPVEDDMILGIYLKDALVQINVLHDMLEDDDLVADVITGWRANGKR